MYKLKSQNPLGYLKFLSTNPRKFLRYYMETIDVIVYIPEAELHPRINVFCVGVFKSPCSSVLLTKCSHLILQTSPVGSQPSVCGNREEVNTINRTVQLIFLIFFLAGPRGRCLLMIFVSKGCRRFAHDRQPRGSHRCYLFSEMLALFEDVAVHPHPCPKTRAPISTTNSS